MPYLEYFTCESRKSPDCLSNLHTNWVNEGKRWNDVFKGRAVDRGHVFHLDGLVECYYRFVAHSGAAHNFICHECLDMGVRVEYSRGLELNGAAILYLYEEEIGNLDFFINGKVNPDFVKYARERMPVEYGIFEQDGLMRIRIIWRPGMEQYSEDSRFVQEA